MGNSPSRHEDAVECLRMEPGAKGRNQTWHHYPLDGEDPLKLQAIAGGQVPPTKMLTKLARRLLIDGVGRQRHPGVGWGLFKGIQCEMTVAVLAVTPLMPSMTLPLNLSPIG